MGGGVGPEQGEAKEGEAKEAGREATHQERNVERATQLAQDGQHAKACQALSSAGMAPDTRANRFTLQAKHPAAAARPADPAPTSDFPQLSFSQNEVEKAARKFRRHSAPGIDGIRTEHIQAVLKAAPGRRDKVIESLTSVVKAMAGGRVPEEVASSAPPGCSESPRRTFAPWLSPANCGGWFQGAALPGSRTAPLPSSPHTSWGWGLA